MQITVKNTLKYTLLPGLVPRVREFFSSGFGLIAMFMAGAFQTARLLPANHPYLNPANNGRYGIRQVMVEARRNLVFRRENADQVILYYTLQFGLVLLMMQVALLILSLSVHSAAAADVGGWWSKFLVNDNPQGDIAFLLLDNVFGMPNIYGSCADPGIACPAILVGTPAPPQLPWPTPFHNALHVFFNFYDLGVAAVGLIVFLYLVVSVVGETAQSGVPFGRRYNQWAPLRMILAIGLLAPLGTGLNTAQLTTLYIAKWGSNLATNGWIIFNQSLTAGGWTPLGMPENLVVQSTAPGSDVMLEFMLVAKTCKYAETGRTIAAYQVYPSTDPNAPTSWAMPADYLAALANSNNHDIIIRFGEQDPAYVNELGNVKPICGEISIPEADRNSPGALAMETDYYNMIVTRWNDGQNDTYGQQIAEHFTTSANKDPQAPLPDGAFVNDSKAWFIQQTAQAVQDGRTAEQQDDRWVQNYTLLGWGGAAMWYNKIAEYNGSLVAASFNLPKPTKFPEVMEYVRNYRTKFEKSLTPADRFNPSLTQGTSIPFPKANEEGIAKAEYTAQSFWTDKYQASSGSNAEDWMVSTFGIRGLYNMVANTNVHPLAQLVGIGRSMMESCIMNLGYGGGAALLGGIMSLADKASVTYKAGQGAIGMSGVMFTLSQINLMVGFFLFYVLPFMPFIYFFFGMGGWVKAVFEAMVGVPLWALAHIRIDGQGIPGPSGMSGYYLLLEIFLRPILIIFGLIGSITIFSAQVMVLNQIWSLVVTNLTGSGGDTTAAAAVAAGQTGSFDFVREALDGFFYTIIYAIIVYMLSLASFKLIDQIPAQIMRWMGAGVRAFGTGEDAGGEFLQLANKLEQAVLSTYKSTGSLSDILNRGKK